MHNRFNAKHKIPLVKLFPGRKDACGVVWQLMTIGIAVRSRGRAAPLASRTRLQGFYCLPLSPYHPAYHGAGTVHDARLLSASTVSLHRAQGAKLAHKVDANGRPRRYASKTWGTKFRTSDKGTARGRCAENYSSQDAVSPVLKLPQVRPCSTR